MAVLHRVPQGCARQVGRRISAARLALGLVLALIAAPAAMAQTSLDAGPQAAGPAEAAANGSTAAAAPGFGAEPAVQPDLSPGIGVIEAPAGAAKSAPAEAFSLAPPGVAASAVSSAVSSAAPGAASSVVPGLAAPAQPPAAIAVGVIPPAAHKPILGAPPVVVELFTAQGCSSCPPADRLIAGLADAPGVLALTWHVDYWDYLGWKDGFASPAHTARQEGYAAVAGERGVYTPQIIVDGQDTLLGLGRAALLSVIEDHAARPSAVIVTATDAGEAHVIQLTPRAAIPGGADVMLIRFLPRRSVQVEDGENRGMKLDYRNVVVGAELLTHWPARAPLRLTVRAGIDPDDRFPDDTSHALLVQQALGAGRPGPILAAVRLD